MRVRAPRRRAPACGVTASIVVAALFVSASAAAAETPLHAFAAVVLSPDGTRVAAIESDEPKVDGEKAHESLTIRRVAGGPPVVVPLPLRYRC